MSNRTELIDELALRLLNLRSKSVMTVFIASLGTMFEAYDFFLVGLLANEIAQNFFPSHEASAAITTGLLGFAAGFVSRPVGAIVFGRLGDTLGRKHTLIITIALMGCSTTSIGFLPSYSSIGIAASIAFVVLRMLQGLPLGGEFSGALIYIAEHAPSNRRGTWMAWIALSTSLGFLLAVTTIILLRLTLGGAAFAEWGWRVPFIMSVCLLVLSIWGRLKLQESPAFEKIKREGRIAEAPIKEAFASKNNLKSILVSVFGIVSGNAVVWYTCQFYLIIFMTENLGMEKFYSIAIVAIATLVTSPTYILSGYLSDKFGCKIVYLSSVFLVAILLIPLFKLLAYQSELYVKQDQIQDELIYTMFFLNICCIVVFCSLVFPAANAMLFSVFETKTKYISLSFSYHLSVVCFGGFLPSTILHISSYYNSFEIGLIYPLSILWMSFFVVKFNVSRMVAH